MYWERRMKYRKRLKENTSHWRGKNNSAYKSYYCKKNHNQFFQLKNSLSLKVWQMFLMYLLSLTQKTNFWLARIIWMICLRDSLTNIEKVFWNLILKNSVISLKLLMGHDKTWLRIWKYVLVLLTDS